MEPRVFKTTVTFWKNKNMKMIAKMVPMKSTRGINVQGLPKKTCLGAKKKKA